jgi:Flp pilus assembly protein TadD
VADSQIALSWHLLALSLIKFGQIDRAERASRRAIQLDARNWEFPARLAVALEIKGDLAGAEAALESGLSLAGKNESLIAHLQNRLENVRQRQQTGS